MKRVISILLSMILCLSVCACAAPEEEIPEPTPNPLEEYSGEWTRESGDGSIVWELRDDGSCLIPDQTYDEVRSIGCYGTWSITADGLAIEPARQLSVTVLEEDGFVKLYCPLLNQTLVRCEERRAAYEAKYVDVKLSAKNFWKYFEFDQVSSPVDENGDRIYKEVFVMRNAKYDDGLIFWAESDVRIDMVYWWTYKMHLDKVPYGASFFVKNYNSVEAEGTMTFVRSDHVASYEYNGKKRTVVLNSGETLSETFDDFRYKKYPY